MITTIAGTGDTGFSGDGGPATGAELAQPFGVAVDGLGNVYIADTSNNVIRRIDPTGVIETVVGGSDGVVLEGPSGVAVDAANNLYFSDSGTDPGHSFVERLAAGGGFTLIAGNGTAGYGGDGGPGSQAELSEPWGVAVDDHGDVYVGDIQNNRVRRIDGSGEITTVAGTGSSGDSGDGGLATSAQLELPVGVAIDASGELFVIDPEASTIRRVDGSGVIATVAGGAASVGDRATATAIDGPQSIAFDAAGNLYITDTFANVVLEVGSDGSVRVGRRDRRGDRRLPGSPATASDAKARHLRDVAESPLDAIGNLYIADTDATTGSAGSILDRRHHDDRGRRGPASSARRLAARRPQQS